MNLMMPREDLFHPIEPYAAGRLPVDGGHTIYWEQSGNPAGVAALFLHGGPGAGASPTHRRFFDPRFWRIVVFDQRGSGRSTPLGALTDNTTGDLIRDIEFLREEMGIERWLVFGGSWGSTLALAYAQAHPERVSALILRGIFLMRSLEIDWFLNGMRQIYPEAWERFASHIPPDERGDLLEAYWRRLTDASPTVQRRAAVAWSLYEGACSTLLPNAEIIASAGEVAHAIGLARIECHYFRNNRFVPEDRLLRDVSRIRHIPATIIQGRYDIVCPIRSADDLHRAWPEADYVVVPDAGHSALEPGIRAALVAATERMRHDLAG